jgi:probable phosphoglycerate mutase
MDSELVVEQVNGLSAVRRAHLSELHNVASGLVALFKSIRISWVPREMNAEADRLVREALGALTKSEVASASPLPEEPDETDINENLQEHQRKPSATSKLRQGRRASVRGSRGRATGEGCEAPPLLPEPLFRPTPAEHRRP